MRLPRGGEGCPVLVLDVVQHAREHQLDYQGLGMLGERIGGGRDVVMRPVKFDPVVDPGHRQTATPERRCMQPAMSGPLAATICQVR